MGRDLAKHFRSPIPSSAFSLAAGAADPPVVEEEDRRVEVAQRYRVVVEELLSLGEAVVGEYLKVEEAAGSHSHLWDGHSCSRSLLLPSFPTLSLLAERQ